MLQKVFVFSLFASLGAFAQPQIHKGTCKEIASFVKDINKNLSDEKKIQVDYCDETSDRNFLGIRSNFKSVYELSSESGLCQDALYVERNMTEFEHRVNLGPSFERKLLILENHSIARGPVADFGGIAGKSLVGIYYPICN